MSDRETDKKEEVVQDAKPNLKYIPALIISMIIVLATPLIYYGFAYARSPEVVRKPLMEHYHFRLQLLVDGKAVNFADKKFQKGYSKDQCNAGLNSDPFHFHDGKDQFVHVHWEGMTGGQWMKYYGWNYIGGPSGALGNRYDETSILRPQEVPIHGKDLPTVPDGSTFYVYTGDEKSYKSHSFDDWKNQDLEKFFGRTSNFPAHKENMEKRKSGLVDQLFPPAYAHGDEDHGDAPHGESEVERLTRINNLEGNVVIFVQKQKPSDAQIKERFNKLAPLTDSTCGG